MTSTNYPSQILCLPTLSYGSRGEDVIRLQKRLNYFGYGLVVDGIFGRATEAAVRGFQRSNGLIVDGIVGPQTWNALYPYDG